MRTILAAASVVFTAGLACAEPVSDYLTIERLATVENMGRMSVNPLTGEVAFGTTGPGSGSAQQIRIMQPDGTVSAFGATVPDPDAVAWDIDGTFGPAGSVLVGSNQGLYSVTPSGEVFRFAHAGADINNPEDLVIGGDGGLYFADYGLSQIKRLSVHGSFSTIAETSSPATRVVVDDQGRVSGLDASGLLTSTSLDGTQNASLTEIAFGNGTLDWQFGTYAIDSELGALVRLFADGSSTVLASGLFDGVDQGSPGWSDAHIGFAPTGEMYLGVPATGAVYSLVPTPGSAVIAGLGGLLAIRRKR
ncbi:MAG: hypothetical protein Phyf2KO_27140 [Phycisphaerales bacterium]